MPVGSINQIFFKVSISLYQRGEFNMQKKKGIPPMSREALLKLSLGVLKEREKRLRAEFKRVKEFIAVVGADTLTMDQLKKLKVLKTAIKDCEWARKKVLCKHGIHSYKEMVPTLKILHNNMAEFATLLNELQEELRIPVNYFILCPDNISGGGLIEGYLTDYKIVYEEKDDGRPPYLQKDFSLNYQCKNEGNPNIRLFAFCEKGHEVKIKTNLEKDLRACDMQFRFSKTVCDNGKDVKFDFNIEPIVNVKLKFEGNMKRKTIDLTIQNAWGFCNRGEFCTVKLYGDPEKLKDAAAIEALVRTIMRYPSRLFDFFTLEDQAKVMEMPVQKGTQVYHPLSEGETVNFDTILKRLKTVQVDNKQIKTDNRDIKQIIQINHQEAENTLGELKVALKKESARICGNISELQQEQKVRDTAMFGWLTALFKWYQNGRN